MIVRLIALALFVAGFSIAHAQDPVRYPTRIVKIIVPFPAGGPTDVFARLMADRLQSTLGQPFIVENRPGGTGTIGTSAVANAEPDGYTLLFGSNSNQVIAPLLRSPRPYDSLSNFRPISMLMTYPFYLIVSNDLPVRTVAELIAYAKANPGKLDFASVGHGSGNHLITELFKNRAGIDAMHIPYKGAGQMQTGMMGGEIQFMFDSVGSSGALVDAGKMRALAVTGKNRSWAAPDIPTLEESGLTGLDAVIWLGVFAPANTPDAIMAKLEREIMAFARLPNVEKRIKDYAATRVGSSGEELAAAIAKERLMWADIIATSKIRVND